MQNEYFSKIIYEQNTYSMFMYVQFYVRAAERLELK